jgi:trimethylamine--corrinoid protein Co-methyltransferase
MRPQAKILSDTDVDKIIDRSLIVLEKVGIHIGSSSVLKMIGAAKGATLIEDRIMFNRDMVEECLKQAPSEIKIYRQDSTEPLILGGDRVHYVAGSVAPYIYDIKAKALREPITNDLIEHIKVLNHCDYIDFQSGSYVLNDVPKAITSSYRYYLSLLYSPKPMFGGAFGTDDLKVIKDMLVVVSGGEKELQDKPIVVIAISFFALGKSFL